MAEDPKPTCFMAMPITTRPEEAALYLDDAHWNHVMGHLFVPAIEAAGFTPVRPVSKGSSMIHADIVKNLEESAMVLCDFSGLNPNVFFELGVRVSLDKPMALVRDEVTRIPFDLGGVNAHEYRSGMRQWDAKPQVEALAEHLREAVRTCAGKNPLWGQFGLTIRAQEADPNASPTEAAIAVLQEQVSNLAQDLRSVRRAGPRLDSSDVDMTVRRRVRDALQGSSVAVDSLRLVAPRTLRLVVDGDPLDLPSDLRARFDSITTKYGTSIEVMSKGGGFAMIFGPDVDALPRFGPDGDR